MAFPQPKPANTPIVRTRQIASTFSRNTARRRDSLVESARRTTKRVSRDAENAVFATV
ncbi:hypothetical protein M404DRAFT_1003810 [Pisolithus tinctorius Marx 270]|uniref:Uncharacterized protein n=1 Tax=Pisolithus tinctorius Marx 270 TaxID=870435 RepID=A0A0C3NH73_PISTI|nr:hypothetical protein M404DRAFT_1003810 [Pisolithus tinctorius Marx 270]